MTNDRIWNSVDTYVEQGSGKPESVRHLLGLQPDIVNDADRTPPGLRAIGIVRAL